MTWVVADFVQEKHFGFCEGLDPSKAETKVFFHARDFIRLTPGEAGPVLGEKVQIDNIEYHSKGPCAKSVRRENPPAKAYGSVSSYDSQRGWGFIRGEDKKEYYFHKKEIVGSWLPIAGNLVEFFSGNLKGKTRACWVSLRRK